MQNSEEQQDEDSQEPFFGHRDASKHAADYLHRSWFQRKLNWKNSAYYFYLLILNRSKTFLVFKNVQIL